MDSINYDDREVTTVSSLIPLVQKLACRFRRDSWSSADREDIRQEGYMGLIDAAARFDKGRGCSLTTFGGRRAAGAMMDYVRRLCRRSRERATADIPADGMGYRREHPEFEVPGSMESGVMLLRFKEFLGSDQDGLQVLDRQEREVIRLRFFEGCSCRDAAVAMRVSPATICRLERRALVKLRESFVSGFGQDAGSADGPDAEGDEKTCLTGLSGIIASLSM